MHSLTEFYTNLSFGNGQSRTPVPTRYKRKKGAFFAPFILLTGADYGARTRHLNLGKVALYQMS